MLFNSLEFVAFFFIVFIVNLLLPVTLRWIWVLLVSCFFYAYAKPSYIPIPIAIAIFTWYAGMAIENAKEEARANKYFIASIFVIVGILIFFKYTDFFSNTIFDIVNNFRSKSNKPLLENSLLINLIAPLGISYITFQAIGYLIEIKRGNHIAEKHLGHFATYLLFFPKMVAGPVERAHNFLPQLKVEQKITYEKFTSGAQQTLWGLFKKLVVADRLGIYINAVYNNYEHHSGITLIAATFFYVIHIYADFSGYTDIALGISRMLGYELMPNFNRPLLAKSVTEFWRKWHISLSTWFADYFFTPLTIAKRDWGNWAPIFASFVTFTVLGFWHGANWTYIIFGALQGLILAIELFTRKQRKNFRKKIPAWLNNITGIGFTFAYFAFASIFFKSDTVHQAISIIKKMVIPKGPFYSDNASTFMFMLLGVFYIMAYDFKKEYFDTKFTLSHNKNWIVRNGYFCLLIIIILTTGVFDGGEFIYFQF